MTGKGFYTLKWEDFEMISADTREILELIRHGHTVTRLMSVSV